MTKENAMSLITETIQEFYTLVMSPLKKNIYQYENEKQKYANVLRLYEEFFGYENAVKNIEEVSAYLPELGDFQMSQLLSLCRDISELYELPVSEKMPEFISDLNAVRYVAPGMPNTLSKHKNRAHRDDELKFIREILGPIGERAYRNSVIFELILKDYKDGGFSFPVFECGIVNLGSNHFSNPLDSLEGRDLLVHEMFHQVQYIQDIPFANLIKEFIIHDRIIQFAEIAAENANKFGSATFINLTQKLLEYSYNRANTRVPPPLDVYAYDIDILFQKSLSPKLSDLPYYEAQAELVGHFAKYYYEARHMQKLPHFYGDRIIKMAQILENSGFITEATRWVYENQLLLNEK